MTPRKPQTRREWFIWLGSYLPSRLLDGLHRRTNTGTWGDYSYWTIWQDCLYCKAFRRSGYYDEP